MAFETIFYSRWIALANDSTVNDIDWSDPEFRAGMGILALIFVAYYFERRDRKKERKLDNIRPEDCDDDEDGLDLIMKDLMDGKFSDPDEEMARESAVDGQEDWEEKLCDPKEFERPPCPLCGYSDLAPIVYGLPGQGLRNKARRGEVVLGGCVTFEDKAGNPTDAEWKCRVCGLKFREGETLGTLQKYRRPGFLYLRKLGWFFLGRFMRV